MAQQDQNHKNPSSDPTRVHGENAPSGPDQRMIESGESPNQLDQTDESQKAADISRAQRRNGNP